MKIRENLPLDEKLIGLKLAEAVVDATGQVLVPAGGEISASLLHGLLRREIASVCVERQLVEDPALLEARRQRAAAAVDRIFRKAGDGEETRQLYRAILVYRQEGAL